MVAQHPGAIERPQNAQKPIEPKFFISTGAQTLSNFLAVRTNNISCGSSQYYNTLFSFTHQRIANDLNITILS